MYPSTIRSQRSQIGQLPERPAVPGTARTLIRSRSRQQQYGAGSWRASDPTARPIVGVRPFGRKVSSRDRGKQQCSTCSNATVET